MPVLWVPPSIACRATTKIKPQHLGWRQTRCQRWRENVYAMKRITRFCSFAVGVCGNGFPGCQTLKRAAQFGCGLIILRCVHLPERLGFPRSPECSDRWVAGWVWGSQCFSPCLFHQSGILIVGIICRRDRSKSKFDLSFIPHSSRGGKNPTYL